VSDTKLTRLEFLKILFWGGTGVMLGSLGFFRKRVLLLPTNIKQKECMQLLRQSKMDFVISAGQNLKVMMLW
jgi:hypothetical protein